MVVESSLELVDLTDVSLDKDTMKASGSINKSVSVEKMAGFFENIKEHEDFFAETSAPAVKQKWMKCKSSPDLTSSIFRERKKIKNFEEVKKTFYTAMSNILPENLMIPVRGKKLSHLTQSTGKEVKDRMMELHNKLNLTCTNGSEDSHDADSGLTRQNID